MPAPNPPTISVNAWLSQDEIAILTELAEQRGVDANSVLRQAIATEKLLADNVNSTDAVLIRKPHGVTLQLTFKRAR